MRCGNVAIFGAKLGPFKPLSNTFKFNQLHSITLKVELKIESKIELKIEPKIKLKIELN